MHMLMVHGSQCHPHCWKNHEPNANPVDPFAQYIGEVSSVAFPRLDAFLTKYKEKKKQYGEKGSISTGGEKKIPSFQT